MQLFDPIIPDSDANPRFLIVRDRWQFTPARRLNGAGIYTFFWSSKRAFVQGFQTHGFAARTWELALFAYLNERAYHVEATSGPPDYLVTDAGMTVAIEATASNPPVLLLLSCLKLPLTTERGILATRVGISARESTSPKNASYHC